MPSVGKAYLMLFLIECLGPRRLGRGAAMASVAEEGTWTWQVFRRAKVQVKTLPTRVVRLVSSPSPANCLFGLDENDNQLRYSNWKPSTIDEQIYRHILSTTRCNPMEQITKHQETEATMMSIDHRERSQGPVTRKGNREKSIAGLGRSRSGPYRATIHRFGYGRRL